MSFTRVSISVFGAIAVVAATLAAAMIWLLLTEPVTVADAVNEGSVSPLIQALASALYEVLSGLLKFL